MYGADQNTCTLPAEVQEWAGIGNGLGEFWSGPFEGITLAFMNDSAGYTFPEIAQIIRENIDAL